MSALRALVVSEDCDWRTLFSDALTDRGCDVHATPDGMEAVKLVRSQMYQVIVVDQALGQMSQMELIFNVHDMLPEMPVAVVSGADVQERAAVWERCGVFFAGRRSDAARRIGEAVTEAKSRHHGPT